MFIWGKGDMKNGVLGLVGAGLGTVGLTGYREAVYRSAIYFIFCIRKAHFYLDQKGGKDYTGGGIT
jgi:hypothetical protein